MFVCCGGFALSACGKSTNEEYKQFKEVMETVVEVLDGKLNQMPVAGEGRVVASAVSRSQIHNLVLGDDDCQTRSSIAYYFEDAKDQSFYCPILAGEVLTRMKKATNFYGVKSYIEYFDQYLMVENNGTNYTSWVYADENSAFEQEYYVYLNLDFKSEDDFEFVNIGFYNDLSRIYYVYGNDDAEMYFIQRHLDDNFVVSSYNGQMIESVDSAVVEAAVALIDDEALALDKGKFRGVKAGCQYNITEEEYSIISEEYFGFGTDDGEVAGFEFVVYDNCLMGFGGQMSQMPETIVLPNNIDSIYIQALMGIAEQVQTIVIPSNVKYIKARGADLMENPPQMMEPGDPAYELTTLTTAQIAELFEFGAVGTVNFVAENSDLFKVEGNNLYLKENNALLALCDASTITDLDLSEDKLSKSAKSAILYGGHNFENLQSIYEKLTEEYEGNIQIPCITNDFLMRMSNAHFNLKSVHIDGVYGYVDVIDGQIVGGPTFALYLNEVDSLEELKISGGGAYQLTIGGISNVEKFSIMAAFEQIDLSQMRIDCDTSVEIHYGQMPEVLQPMMLNNHTISIGLVA